MIRYKVIIDMRAFEHPGPSITGMEVKEYVQVPPEYGVWLKVPGLESKKEIGDNDKVDVSQPGREHFVTGPKGITGEG